MKCPGCNAENYDGNITCEYCGKQLQQTSYVSQEEPTKTYYATGESFDQPTKTYYATSDSQESKTINLPPIVGKIIIIIIFLNFFAPFIIVGIVFSGLGLYSKTEEDRIKTTSEQTTGTFISYGECDYSDGTEICSGIYKYEVNGIEYQTESNVLTNIENIKDEEIIYYDPTNPSNGVIIDETTSTIFTIIGAVLLIIIIIPIIIFIVIARKVKKNKKQKEGIDNKPITI